MIKLDDWRKAVAGMSTRDQAKNAGPVPVFSIENKPGAIESTVQYDQGGREVNIFIGGKSFLMQSASPIKLTVKDRRTVVNINPEKEN